MLLHLLEPRNFVGMVVAVIAFSAGVSVWPCIGTVHFAIVELHRKPTKLAPRSSTSENVLNIVIAAGITAAMHGLAWGTRWAMRRRPQTIGMSVTFWNVLYYTGYALGFFGGGIMFLAFPN